MKIIFCDNGISMLLNFRIDVIRHYIDLGNEVILIYPDMTHREELAPQIPQGCRTVRVNVNPNSTNIFKDTIYLRTLYRIYRNERPDVVFHYTIKPNIYGTIAARLAGVKNKVSMVAGLGYVFNGNSIRKRLARLLYKIGLRLSNVVITLNSANRDLLVDHGYVCKDKIVLFECGEGVNLASYKFIRNEFGCVRFLMVARVLYDKGYTEFVEAARIVRRHYPEVAFELLGPIDDKSPMRVPREVIEKDVAEGAIDYLGVTNDVPAVVGRDGVVVVVVSSYHEGMNRSLMEACAMGRPVITSDIPGCRELVDETVNGFKVAPKNAESLALAMESFISLPRERKIAMGEASYRKAISQYDMQITLKRYDWILHNLGIET